MDDLIAAAEEQIKQLERERRGAEAGSAMAGMSSIDGASFTVATVNLGTIDGKLATAKTLLATLKARR